MVLDTCLFYTQQYKVRIKGKMMQSREMSSALPYIPKILRALSVRDVTRTL